jgi:hypothetical protein
MCVLVVSTSVFEIFFILIRTGQDMIKMYNGVHVKYLLFCPILMKLGFFLTHF